MACRRSQTPVVRMFSALKIPIRLGSTLVSTATGDRGSEWLNENGHHVPVQVPASDSVATGLVPSLYSDDACTVEPTRETGTEIMVVSPRKGAMTTSTSQSGATLRTT